MSRRDLAHAPLIEAANGRTPSRAPVWFMRQAGRSLPEYRKAREGIPMLDSCFMPELLAEITLQPVRRHGVDAAILFSDIVLPLYAAGIGLDIVAGTGPVVAEPVRTPEPVAETGDEPRDLTGGEPPADEAEVEALYDLCFAPGRTALSSYRLREGVPKVADLCLVLRDGSNTLMAAIRFWPVRIARRPVLLLGPIAVHPTAQGEGLGGLLMRDSLTRARKLAIFVGPQKAIGLAVRQVKDQQRYTLLAQRLTR